MLLVYLERCAKNFLRTFDLRPLLNHIENSSAFLGTAISIFGDLWKSFDTVSHTNLVESLEITGFRGIAYELLKSYLNNREQCVKIGNTLSSKRSELRSPSRNCPRTDLVFGLYKYNI